MEYILEVKNLNYKNILNNLSLFLYPNTFNILMGPNGSGKTTFIKCIADLIEYSGEIIFNNKIICKNNIKDIYKEISIVSDFNINLKESVIENIMYPLVNLGYSLLAAKKEVYVLSKKLKIDNLLTKNISDLTSAEKKIVILASQIISNPKLLILDDSLDELNDAKRNIILKYLKSLKMTVLFVTNKEKDVALADNIILMKDGNILLNDKYENTCEEEKKYLQASSNIPFLINLSNKLIAYNLLDEVILDKERIINTIWK